MTAKALPGHTVVPGEELTADEANQLWGTPHVPPDGKYTIKFSTGLDVPDVIASQGFIYRSAVAPTNTSLLWYDLNLGMYRYWNGSLWWPMNGLILTNRTGGQLINGDVVVLSAINDLSVVFAAADRDLHLPMVCRETIANLGTGVFQVWGRCPLINLLAAGSTYQGIWASATNKKATVTTPTTQAKSGRFGFILGTSATPAAMLYGHIHTNTLDP